MLDTLQYTKDLEAAGFTREQAEAQARALYKHIKESVATREQLEHVREHLDTKIDALDQRLSAQITGLDQRLSAQITGLDQRLSAQITGLRTYILASAGVILAPILTIAIKVFIP